MAISFRPGGAPVEESVKEGRLAVLYGPPFSGKTSTLEYDKRIKVLLIDMDMNSSGLKRCGNVDIIYTHTFDDHLFIKDGIDKGFMKVDGQKLEMNYDLYVFDSFTRFEELIKEHVLRHYAPNRKRELKDKFGCQADWQDLQDIEIREVRDCHTMTRRANNSINALWIGHDMINPHTEDFTKTLQLRLQGKYAAPGIMGAVDAVFYMYKGQDPYNPSDQTMKYGIYTVDAGPIKAAARLPVRDRIELPPIIWYPKWGDVFQNIGATNLVLQ